MDKYLLNMAGEYRVCTELLRRGLLSSVTMGNLKGADIHVVTNDRKVIVVEVKTTGSNSNRFVTGFYQKYKAQEKPHPDFWVLCKMGEVADEFYILTHQELSVVQARRNGFTDDFDWTEVHAQCAKGVDNVLVKHVNEYKDKWQQITDLASA